MNEISLLFFGQPEKLSSALLLNLNVIEFREETIEYSGLYSLENKFGKEVLRKLSLDLNNEGSDWLIYRYLSEGELSQLNNFNTGQRIYVLLQNYMTLDYFKNCIPKGASACFYIVGQGELLKPIASVAGEFNDRNVFFLRTVKKHPKSSPGKESARIPDFLAALLKLVLNPVDEFNVITRNLMHSNQRVLYRFIELLNFLHFVIYMAFVNLYRGLGVQLFWKSIAMAGFIKVAGVKSKFFVRHIVLMQFYKAWGLAVDGVHFLIRVRDKIILNVYYRAIQKFFYGVIHRSFHKIWFYVISPLYYKIVRPKLISVYGWLEYWIYYKGIHRLMFLFLKIAGYSWEKFISPLYFASVHRFAHSVLKPTFNFIYYKAQSLGYKFIHFLYYKVMLPFYYNVIHRFYYGVICRVYYSVIHRFYYGVIHRFYYGVIHRFYYSVIHRFLRFVYSLVLWVYFEIVHKAYHRCVKPAFSFVFYRGFHLLFHRVIKPFYTVVWYDFLVSAFYYGLVQKSYYKVMVIVLYRIWPWVRFNIFIRFHHFIIYKIRHFFLMGLFKTYGLGYDLFMLAARITKLYLLYPFFKIYWFTSFQYNKRIKKFFV